MNKIITILSAIILLTTNVYASSITVDIYGTTAVNAQNNITKNAGANNSINVTAWGIGDNTKTFWMSINGNISDTIRFTIHNLTISRVLEVRINSSSYNSYQADNTGTISFTRVQTIQNQTYTIYPAINTGGYNTTWAQFWTFPSLFGSNLTQIFLSYLDITKDVNMNGFNITNTTRIANTTKKINVKDWGAAGDGIADDGQAIQNALNYSNNTGIPLYIPAGSYNLSSRCLLLDNQNGNAVYTIIEGDGESSILYNRCSSNNPTLTIKKYNTEIKDIAINGVANYYNEGINISETAFIKINRVTVNANADGTLGQANLVLLNVSTIKVDEYTSWQSGRSNGASQNTNSGIAYGILAKGNYAHDVTITRANIVNTNQNFSAIMWNTNTISTGIRILYSELENQHEAVNFSRNVYNSVISDNFMDNANINLSAHVSDSTDNTLQNIRIANCEACNIFANGSLTFLKIEGVNTPNWVWLGNNITNITLMNNYFSGVGKYQAGRNTCYFNTFAPTPRPQGCVS